jgi:hypothetical protein
MKFAVSPGAMVDGAVVKTQVASLGVVPDVLGEGDAAVPPVFSTVMVIVVEAA